ncbi:DUF3732 domain-containing protein [Plebeiibacterium marinum]|uniref:DUF3732 domain-containing protein n=1 Tax=Plebeiibacterium marinum TaxID=2992111 RepID=A0AAE3MHU4_9BACT|nr:DUF3732 domain-containing protein [Plebeiobacterium marinum]MCW3808016.1 DUF3732 domain-containing protein [Plebeiobacterium marinum]
MKFTINKVLLWSSKTDYLRQIEFEPNKVNLLTGTNDRGKTAILEIISYCLLSEKVDIPQEVINENVSWYGINITINRNTYTIARAKLGTAGETSFEIYLSKIGEIPNKPTNNSKKREVLSILDDEFNLKFAKFDFEGEKADLIKNVSYRSLLILNVLTDNVITHRDDYLDFGAFKQDKNEKEKRTKENFDVAFNLAIGAEDPSNVILRKRIEKLEKLKNTNETKRNEFEKILYSISKDAKNFGIIDDTIVGFDDNYKAVKNLMQKFNNDKLSTDLVQFEDLKTQELILTRQIKSLKRYKRDFDKYNELNEKDVDSIQAIDYVYNNFSEVIETPIVLEFIENLETEYKNIKKQILDSPFEAPDVSQEINELQEQLSDIQKELEQFPLFNWNFENEVGKYIHIGRLKERFMKNEEYKAKEKFDLNIAAFEKEIAELEPYIQSKHIDKTLTKSKIETLIQKQIDNSNALEEYKNYKASFDLADKIIRLRKSQFKYFPGVGSSSNYLFLHLSFFLGLHEFFLEPREAETAFVAPFLIIDQFSRPFAKEATQEQRITKFQKAMKLLTGFIEYLNLRHEDEFQFIILDNARQDMIEKWNLPHIHFVEDFRNDNALITKEMMKK